MNMPCRLALTCDLRPETPQQILETLTRRLPLGQEPQALPTTMQVHCDVAHDELESYLALLESIAPYSATVGFVGYVRLPWDMHPALIYFKDGNVSVF